MFASLTSQLSKVARRATQQHGARSARGVSIVLENERRRSPVPRASAATTAEDERDCDREQAPVESRARPCAAVAATATAVFAAGVIAWLLDGHVNVFVDDVR